MELLDIYLQSQTHKVISKDVSVGMLSHCYMISSKDELLLSSFAFFVAKEILCLSDNAPCDNCVNCNKISHNNMVDLKVYPRSEKSLVVDDINEIVDDCFIRPMDSKYKIYILQKFDECTVQAQNKILKTLEEPPQNVVFILTSTNDAGVLATIASRSKKVNEPELDYDILLEYLKGLSAKDAEVLASMSDGSLTIANKLANNTGSVEIVNLVFDILTNFRTSADVLKYSSKIVSLKKDFGFFLETLIAVLRDIAVFEKSNNLIFKTFESRYHTLNKIYNNDMIAKIIEKIYLIPMKLDFNCNLTGVVDQMLLDILEVKFLCQR